MFLVTGGTGFIGSHLVEELSAHREPTRCLVRPRKHAFALPSGIEIAYGDLVSGEGMSGEGMEDALRGVGCVIHLAGITKALSKHDYYAGNAHATENLARAVAKTGARLIHVSSLAAIGPSTAGAPVTEDSAPHPVGDYGKSKLEAERIVRSLVPDAIIVRPPVVYGPRDTDVFQIFKSISQGLAIEIAGGERWFQSIYVKDLASGILLAARQPNVRGRDYFLAAPKPSSWSQFRDAAATVMRKHPRVVRIPAPIAYGAGLFAEGWSRITHKPGILSREKIREAQHHYWTCDTSRAAGELGFEAETPLEAGIAETLAWYKEAGWLKY